ncbi:hypothetical protein Taro_041767 [Colocasia esculenta]|uniref:Uncharacterized protein n=1 Tax=Colocasia esculenta TaxID=4460 RepID=A0A843WMA4_COLES|nr:hypothetical protein [Colocasia esculenta]
MVAWVARATTEQEDYELDEEVEDPEDPPRPNTFLVVEVVEEEEGEHGDVEAEDEVDLLDDLRMEYVMSSRARSQSMREAPIITSSQPRRKVSRTQSTAPSQAVKGKAVATSQPTKGKDKGQACGPAKGIVIREPPAPTQKKKSWFSWGSKKGEKIVTPVEDPLDIADLETLDPNAEETSPEDSPRLSSSRSHDSMTTGSPEGLAVDSDSYNTMVSDFDRISTHKSVGSYGDHSYQAESSDTGYPAPYSYPPPFVPVHVPIQKLL